MHGFFKLLDSYLGLSGSGGICLIAHSDVHLSANRVFQPAPESLKSVYCLG